MRKFFKTQLEKVSPVEWIGIGTLVLAGLAVYWAAITDWFSTIWAWWTIPGLAIVIASGVVIADRVSALRSRAPFKPLDSESLRTMVEQWFLDYGYTITRHPADGNFFNKEVAFIFQAVGADAIPVHIGYSTEGSMLYLSSYYVVPEQIQAEFDAMTGSLNSSMLDDIRIEIAHFEVSYNGVTHPLRQIGLIDQIIYDESFSKIRLLEKFTHVAAAYSVIEAIVRRSAMRYLMEKLLSKKSDQQQSDEIETT